MRWVLGSAAATAAPAWGTLVWLARHGAHDVMTRSVLANRGRNACRGRAAAGYLARTTTLRHRNVGTRGQPRLRLSVGHGPTVRRARGLACSLGKGLDRHQSCGAWSNGRAAYPPWSGGLGGAPLRSRARCFRTDSPLTPRCQCPIRSLSGTEGGEAPEPPS